MENILIGIKKILPTIDRTKISAPKAEIVSIKEYKPKGRKR